MLQNLTIRDDPLIVGDELIAYGRRGNGGGKQSRDNRGLPRTNLETCRHAVVRRFVQTCSRADVPRARYSHSIVAGGFELTS